MATKKEIAKLAGVSTATVTNVYNHSKYVGPDVRAKVMDAAKQLGYTDAFIDLVLVINDASNPHYNMIFEGLSEAAKLYGAQVSMLLQDKDHERTVEKLVARKASGVFFTNLWTNLEPEQYQRLKSNGIYLIHSWTNFNMDFDIIIDKLTSHLIDLGHTRIAYLTGFSLTEPSNARYMAFVKAMENHGLKVDPMLMVEGHFPYETNMTTGYRYMKELLDRTKDFTAVIALNDLMAIGAIRAINEVNLKIPEDVSIVGCDDINMAEFIVPPLTTLRLPAKEMGIQAVHSLIRGIQGRPSARMHINVDLVLRQSTAKAKK